MTYDNRNLLAVGKILFQVIGEALCSHTNGIDVHTIASRTHYTTETTRTKFKVFIKALYKVCFVLVFKHALYGCLCFRIKYRCEPLLGLGLTQRNQFRVIFHTIIKC